MKRYIVAALACLTLYGIFACKEKLNSFSNNDLSLIFSDTASPMRVLSIYNSTDSMLLRSQSANLTKEDIQSDAYRMLASRLISTVTDSTVDGVGLAAPQVGILKRVVAVQRFDKEGAPFEVYPNIYIKEYLGQRRVGREGCLSIPDTSGLVERFETLIISYVDSNSAKMVEDTVHGFTAVIFQHEVDHLKGVLYIDSTSALSSKF